MGFLGGALFVATGRRRPLLAACGSPHGGPIWRAETHVGHVGVTTQGLARQCCRDSFEGKLVERSYRVVVRPRTCT